MLELPILRLQRKNNFHLFDEISLFYSFLWLSFIVIVIVNFEPSRVIVVVCCARAPLPRLYVRILYNLARVILYNVGPSTTDFLRN